VFGRRKRAEAEAEAAREAERRALFAKLAERPEHICPFLGLAQDRTGYVDGVSDEHRCYAFGDPAPLSAEQQTRVCQERGYGNCPRYLRGVLVIPTEELEALRRPRAPVAQAPTAAAPPARRRRAPILAILVLLLAVAAGGGVAYLLLGQRDLVGVGSPTPTPASTPTAAPTSAPATAAPTSPPPTAEPTETPRPTPRPDDVFAFYQVQVVPGDYVLYTVDGSGVLTATREATFARRSEAPVDLVETASGRHWRTREGDYQGWSYVFPESIVDEPFEIWRVFTRVEGDFSYEGPLPEDEL
jgi:hypothetical protein